MIKPIEFAFLVATLFFALSSAATNRNECPIHLGDTVNWSPTLTLQTYPEAWLVFARLTREQIIPGGLPQKTYKVDIEDALNVILEVQQAIMNGNLRIDFSGPPKVQFDPLTGSPDFYTYRLLRLLERRMTYMTPHFAPEVNAFIPILVSAKKASHDEMWSTPYYRQLEQFQISEYDMGGVWGGKKGSVKKAIVDQWWAHRDTVQWWLNSNWYGSNITNETSRSPLQKIENSYRIVWWIKAGNRINRIMDPTRMRVSETYKKLKPDSERGDRVGVEILVNRAVNEPPMGFFFNDFLGELVPSLQFDGKPIENACIGCHATEKDGRIMAFTPYFLTKFEDWKDRGYGADAIPTLMRERAEAAYFHSH